MQSDDDYQLLGLTSLQANVITTLLELGGEASAPDIISELSTKQKVNRTSIYSVLTKLEQMGIILVQDGNPTKYGLFSTSPERLMEYITQSQTEVNQTFKQELVKAKNTQKRPAEYELYYLKDKKQIVLQLEEIINQADDYLLIMATSTTLVEIEEQITKKKEKYECNILVIPTWNPDNRIDFQAIIKRYKDILGDDFVSPPLRIFEKIVPIMSSFVKTIPKDLQKISQETYFIQALTETKMLMATHIGEQQEFGSGFYSREPLISQMMHILFLSLFEQSMDIPDEIISNILQVKVNHTMDALLRFFDYL